jgi:DNA-directed RNA polymerase sigma subunit (sigma70/sigma32)
MTKEVPLGEVKESLKIFRQNYRQFESKYLEGMKYKKK